MKTVIDLDATRSLIIQTSKNSFVGTLRTTAHGVTNMGDNMVAYSLNKDYYCVIYETAKRATKKAIETQHSSVNVGQHISQAEAFYGIK